MDIKSTPDTVTITLTSAEANRLLLELMEPGARPTLTQDLIDGLLEPVNEGSEREQADEA